MISNLPTNIRTDNAQQNQDPYDQDSDLESTASSAFGSSQSVSNGSRQTDEENLDAIKDQLTKKESRAVFQLRVSVMMVLALAAAGVSLTVYLLTRKAELDELKIQYDGSAEKILDSFNRIFQEMGSVSGLAVSDTAHSVDHNLPFPYMTMTNFQEKAGNARSLSKTLFVSISNVVTKDELVQYDEFVLGGNNTWM